MKNRSLHATAGVVLCTAGFLLAGCGRGPGPQPPPSIPEPGSTIQDCDACPKLVVVAKDEGFAMGSPAGEAGRESDEAVRPAGIVAAFAVGVYEVTFAQWDACVAGGGCSHRPDDRGWGRGRAAGDRREPGRRAGVRRVAVERDRRAGIGC